MSREGGVPWPARPPARFAALRRLVATSPDPAALHCDLLGAAGARRLGVVIEATADRGLWLAEGIVGPDTPANTDHLRALIGLREVLRHPHALALPKDRVFAVMHRRAVDPVAPPSLRGGALGLLWSAGAWADPDEALGHALRAARGASRPSTLGDFLCGLFALAREEVLHTPGLVAAVDEVVADAPDDDWLVALPALRLAFAWFPPRERARIAEAVAALHGRGAEAAAALVRRLDVPVDVVLRGGAVDLAVEARLDRWGLRAGARATDEAGL